MNSRRRWAIHTVPSPTGAAMASEPDGLVVVSARAASRPSAALITSATVR